MGEFLLVASVADRGATENSAIKEVFEFVTFTYLGLDNSVIVGGDLVATPDSNEALARQQTSAAFQLVRSALPAITEQYSVAAVSATAVFGAPASQASLIRARSAIAWTLFRRRVSRSGA